MDGLKPKILLLFFFNIPLILFLLSTFFLPSYGAIHLYPDEDSNFSVYNDGMREIELKINIAAEEKSTNNNNNNNNNTSHVIALAADRTHRRDPINGFQYYTGGWNITNINYLASVAYSAGAPIVLAGIWLLLFGLILLILCCRRCCCTKTHYGYSELAYAFTLTLLLLLTLSTIAGVVGVYKVEKKLEISIIDTVSYVLSEADHVVVNLQHLLGYLRDSQNVGVGPLSLPLQWKKEIDDRANLVSGVADQFRNVTSTNRAQLTSYTMPLRTVLLCIATAMLVVAVSGLLFSLLGMQCLVYCLGFIGWLIVAVALILAGIFLLVHNVVADTHVAVDEWLMNPTANSALENIIPKVDNQTVANITHMTKGATYSLILMVNQVITNVSNAEVPPDVGPPVYYNQSGPLLPLFCNPYDNNLNDSKCKENEVYFNNFTEVWREYVCTVSADEICTTQGRLTPKHYTQFTASANVSYGLIKGIPFVLELIDTTYLQKLFGAISKRYLSKLESYTKLMYIDFIIISFGVMISIIFWFVYARQRRHRAYTLKIDKKVAKGFMAH